MDLLEGVLKDYAWGSVDAIAQLQERTPSGAPEAEFWWGAHSGGPSRLIRADGGVDLRSAIHDDPAGILGERVCRRFGGRLPFLVKLLAAERPLSLQVHPNLEEAAAGFDREESLGLAVDDPRRSFRDRNHKPELICAVSTFTALSGFRDLAASAELVAGLGVPGLDRLQRPLGDGDVAGLVDAAGGVLTMPRESARALAEAVSGACAEDRGAPEFAAERSAIAHIGSHWPGDPGIVLALLLNLVELAPGEALFLGAGRLHCYLSGVGVEVMASSDNVVRGGLTQKHIDVRNLRCLLRPAAGHPDVQRPTGPRHQYEIPVDDFALERIELDGSVDWRAEGPEVLVPIGGSVSLDGDVNGLELAPGRAAIVTQADGSVTVTGEAVLYRCHVPV